MTFILFNVAFETLFANFKERVSKNLSSTSGKVVKNFADFPYPVLRILQLKKTEKIFEISVFLGIFLDNRLVKN